MRSPTSDRSMSELSNEPSEPDVAFGTYPPTPHATSVRHRCTRHHTRENITVIKEKGTKGLTLKQGQEWEP